MDPGGSTPKTTFVSFSLFLATSLPFIPHVDSGSTSLVRHMIILKEVKDEILCFALAFQDGITIEWAPTCNILSTGCQPGRCLLPLLFEPEHNTQRY